MGYLSRTIDSARLNAAPQTAVEWAARLHEYRRPYRVGDVVRLPPRKDQRGVLHERTATVTIIHPVNDKGERRYTVQEIRSPKRTQFVTVWNESELTPA